MWPQQLIARIEGGLGNQLFQYAAARSLADRLGCELALDLRGLAENADRPYQLDRYHVRASIADDTMLQRLPSARASRRAQWCSNLSQAWPWLFSFPAFWPRSFAFDSRFAQIRRPVFLIGYWQSEKYFAWNRPRLMQDISLRKALVRDRPLLEKIQGSTSVALHIRRGDYVSNANAAAFHGLCDLRYYVAAVQLLRARLRDPEVFVFSDDSQWAREHLALGLPTYFVESSGEDSGMQDMELMRHCKHHVLANSSFSWWGAWRCENPQQQVIAPRQWFKDTGVDTSDVIPSRWQLLD